MEKFEFEDEIYYYTKNGFLDCHFMKVNNILKEKLAKFYFNSFNINDYDANSLGDYIIQLKDLELYSSVIKIANKGIEKFGNNLEFIKLILPIMTSSFRSINQPQKAIEIGEKFIKNDYKFQTVALLTSLAAAYCDIGDFQTAKELSDRAYAKQGGSAEYANELSLVYQRINKYLN